MVWNDGLSNEQQQAARQIGSHVRLLAGPGTGKTHVITRRVSFLITQEEVNPDNIVVITFTRAAAAEIRERVISELGPDRVPRISTLHSFALRQLLRNTNRIETLPKPLRIADDWEERHIILEDIRKNLAIKYINDVKELFARLASDWESLATEQENWELDPAFLGAWRVHRNIYGYTLRSELIYQLKRAMEQIGDFQLDESINYLIVDEYQDLNMCDLVIIQRLVNTGAELFAAGDDDQSIYGFRMAFPEGIRNFPVTYSDSIDCPLEICHRCDPEILRIGEFVAQLDTNRITKNIRAESEREGGIVRIGRFDNQFSEANGIAQICQHLIQQRGYLPDDILILLRSNRYGAYSNVLSNSLEDRGIPVSTGSEVSVIDEREGRIILAALRLVVNVNDDLGWRTIIQERRNNQIGPRAIEAIVELASQQGIRFAEAILEISSKPTTHPRFGMIIHREVEFINNVINNLPENFDEKFEHLTNHLIEDEDKRELVLDYLLEVLTGSGVESINEILRNFETLGERYEQERAVGVVNILTMHKAKGLTAKAVFVVAVEDEHIPGRNESPPEIGDERRLLYVSLTRAKHILLITYCQNRIGRQMRLGRSRGPRRHLTRFLQDAPIHPQGRADFINSIIDT